MAKQSLRQGGKVREAWATQAGKLAQGLVQPLDRLLPLVKQAIAQTLRRVLDGEMVPAKEKIVSLFEPHTQIIVRHKAGRPVEFGRKVWLDEVEGGIISRYVVLEQVGQDQPHLKGSIAGHKERFGKPPWLLAGDRGVHCRGNEVLARKEGVKRLVIPYAGKGASGTAAFGAAVLGSVSSRHRRADQGIRPPLGPGALSGSRRSWDGALGRLGDCDCQPGQDCPEAGNPAGGIGEPDAKGLEGYARSF